MDDQDPCAGMSVQLLRNDTDCALNAQIELDIDPDDKVRVLAPY